MTIISRVRGVICASTSSAEKAKPRLSCSAIGTGRRAGPLDQRAVDRKAGVRVHDLGTRLAEHGDRHEHGDLAAGHDHHPVRGDLEAAPQRHVGRHRLAQRQDAVGGRVAVVAVAQRLDRGLDDMRRGREVGLADAEIDDRAALLLQAGRARQHLERAFGAEPAHGRGELHRYQPPGYEGRACLPPAGRPAIAAEEDPRMEWFEETLHAGWRQGIRVERVLYRDRTEHQDLMIFESLDWGRVLALDGVVQTTTGDEFCYHEMIVHVPILAHGDAREVLIIGGGDGGCLREALKHAAVARVTQVEIDAGVIDLSRRWLPTLSDGAFDHPKARVVIADGARFAAECRDRFDVVIVDSTDPQGPGAVLFTTPFYRDVRALLNPGGIMVTQCGNPSIRPGRAGRDAGGPGGGRLRAGRLLPDRRPDLYRRRHGVGVRDRRSRPRARPRPSSCAAAACRRACATTLPRCILPPSPIRPG